MKLRNTILTLSMLVCAQALAMEAPPQNPVDWDDVKKEARNRLEEVLAEFPTTSVPAWLHYEIECNLFFVSRQAAVKHLQKWANLSLDEQNAINENNKNKAFTARIAELARCTRIEEERQKKNALALVEEAKEQKQKIAEQKEQELLAIFLTNKGLHKRRSYRQTYL